MARILTLILAVLAALTLIGIASYGGRVRRSGWLLVERDVWDRVRARRERDPEWDEIEEAMRA